MQLGGGHPGQISLSAFFLSHLSPLRFFEKQFLYNTIAFGTLANISENADFSLVVSLAQPRIWARSNPQSQIQQGANHCSQTWTAASAHQGSKQCSLLWVQIWSRYSAQPNFRISMYGSTSNHSNCKLCSVFTVTGQECATPSTIHSMAEQYTVAR